MKYVAKIQYQGFAGHRKSKTLSFQVANRICLKKGFDPVVKLREILGGWIADHIEKVVINPAHPEKSDF